MLAVNMPACRYPPLQAPTCDISSGKLTLRWQCGISLAGEILLGPNHLTGWGLAKQRVSGRRGMVDLLSLLSLLVPQSGERNLLLDLVEPALGVVQLNLRLCHLILGRRLGFFLHLRWVIPWTKL